VRIPDAGGGRGRDGFFVAGEDAGRLADEAGGLLEQAVGVSWYDAPGSPIDRAAIALCLLRRAAASVGGGIEHGDEAVRRVLEGASPLALAWISSRAVSYMDENEFPELMAPWLEEATTEG
jgi:hypothetical protein